MLRSVGAERFLRQPLGIIGMSDRKEFDNRHGFIQACIGFIDGNDHVVPVGMIDLSGDDVFNNQQVVGNDALDCRQQMFGAYRRPGRQLPLLQEGVGVRHGVFRERGLD